jgi:hypothetical protein
MSMGFDFHRCGMMEKTLESQLANKPNDMIK